MSTMSVTVVILVVFSLCCCSPTQGRVVHSKPEIEAQIDEFVEAVIECHNIPGLSLAVVRDGQPYLSKGYGVKDLDTGEPMTNKTLLVLASVTKAFVSSVVGLMLDETEGVNWDTPIRDILGDWFYFHESHRTTRATVRDLLSHRMGLPGHNAMRIQGFTTREMMERIRFLEFLQEWRQAGWYNNLMYGLASYVAETLAGGTLWEDIARQRLFTPLGMDATTFVQQAEDRWEEEFAKGYINDDGALREVSLEVTKAYYDTISAPGGVSSNSEDMAKWLAMHLNDGEDQQGEEVIPSPVLTQAHSPTDAGGTPSIIRPDYPVTYSSEKWALGWYEGYYRGFKKSSHGGSRDGYRGELSMLPDMGIGIWTGLNRDNGGPQDYIHMYIMDLLLDEEPWVDIDIACGSAARGVHTKGRKQPAEHHAHGDNLPPLLNKDIVDYLKKVREHKKEVHHDRRKKVAHADEDYLGMYGDYAYGNATVFINQTSGLLSLVYGAAEWALTEIAGDDRFNAQGIEAFWYWSMTVNFARDEDDEVTEVTLPFQVGANPTFVKGRDMTTAPPPPELCDP